MIFTVLAIGGSILVTIGNEWRWKEKADSYLERHPLLLEIGTYEDRSMLRRVDLIEPIGVRSVGEDRENVELYLSKHGFRSPKSCDWLQDKPFDDLSDFSTCYLRVVEFGNCKMTNLIAAKYDQRQQLEELVASSFSFSIC